MGILRRTEEELKPERLEDNLDDYVLDSSDEEPTQGYDTADTVSVTSLPVTPRRRKERRGGRGAKSGLGDGPRCRAGLGHRRQRRIDQARALDALAEEVCEDLSDLLPSSVSSFAQLFAEPAAMETWTAFVAASEEEQRRILSGRPVAPGPDHAQGTKLGGAAQGKTDGRQAHPAFSAEAAFGRLDGRLRQLLCRAQVPRGKLEWTERELSDFFQDDPQGVWLGSLESSYDRLLTHAVAQWLGLRSHSLPVPPTEPGPKPPTDSSSDDRRTQVENPRPYFAPPREGLVPFLGRRRQRSSNSRSGDT